MKIDFYMSWINAANRLVKEWKKYGDLIIAYDFDNTVYDFHKEGHIYEYVPNLLRQCKELGAKLVVFTASPTDRYSFIAEYLEKRNIPYDTINENPLGVDLPEGRKLYYNILLDDRAGLGDAVRTLEIAVKIMKGGNQ